MSVHIKIVDAHKSYGSTEIISGLSVDIEPGEFFTLLGPSGCGKTTLLRMIAGFNTVDGGDIYFDEQRINDLDPAKRHIGMVFQNYAIFPHLTARQNVAFGLKNMDFPRRDITATADKYLELVQIDQWADQMPERLSGGQQQRIALARALVTSPSVLLMDEPLSNLDAKLRVEMREVIRELQRRVGITTVYVTHDQEEAMAISDRIAVMRSGEIQQLGTPQDVYLRPANTFVANFIGLTNIIDATLSVSGGESRVRIGEVEFSLPDPLPAGTASGAVKISVRPEDFVVESAGAPADSDGTSRQGHGARAAVEPTLNGTVAHGVFLGASSRYFVDLDNGTQVQVSQESEYDAHIPDGERVRLGIKMHRVNLYDAAGATNLRHGQTDSLATSGVSRASDPDALTEEATI